MMPDTEQAARDFYNSSGGSYAPVEPAAPAPVWPVPGLVQAASPDAAVAAVLEAAGTPVAVPAAPLTDEDRGDALYNAPTRGSVDWSEPGAQPADIRLQAPYGVLDTSDEGKAALMRLREGFAEAGAGQTLANELFGDAVRVHQSGTTTATRSSGETELRGYWGPRYEAQVSAAQGLIQRAALRCPEIIPFLERTGLGNDPAFVRKVAMAATRQRGRPK